MNDLETLFSRYPAMVTVFGVALVVIAALVADRIAKRLISVVAGRIVRETATRFDDLLLEVNAFGRLAHLAPALVAHVGIQLVPGVSPAIQSFVQQASAAAMVLVSISAIGAFLTAGARTYARSPAAQQRPIEAYIQVTKIAIYVVGSVLFIAALTGRSPLLLLSGIGAVTAVLLLIFRDTILSFVASLQMASYDMVRVGDWLEMEQYGADGDVIEITLHTVKIQNWDKTITAIPTYKLIEAPFKNWRGMRESGGRRIKRAFYIDMNSIRFLTDAELDRLESFVVLSDYIREKRRELAKYNQEFASDPARVVNSRRLTNVGTLRAYLVAYLRRHPKINQRLTLMVRQLAPTPEGLPIELYVFTDTTAWVEYEAIQADIFDHVFSIVSEFGLRVFQAPSGGDFARLQSEPRP